MANNSVETLIGAVVLSIAGGFLYYAAQSADFNSGTSYDLNAKFFKIEGVSTGSDVRVSGVKVGSIKEVELDPATYQANIVFSLRSDIKLPSDSSAKISSEGLLGGSFLAIEPGGSEYYLEAGEAIEYTQGSVSLVDLIGKAIHGATGGD